MVFYTSLRTLLGFLIVFRLCGAASSSSQAHLIAPELAQFLNYHATDLPSSAVAETCVNRVIREHKNFLSIVRALQYPDRYVKAPTRLLFVGPSGSGKTVAATSLIKYLQKDQQILSLFIKGSSIANTYQNSGATFFHELFTCLEQHPEHKFMVIIDELSAVTTMSERNDNIQQDNTAMALWTSLDSIKDRKHICVIGTDNNDPETLTEQLKTRFNGRVFSFSHPDTSFIVDFMRDRLNDNYGRAVSPSDVTVVHRCSDSFLNRIAQDASYLSLREVENLIDDARTYAIVEKDDTFAAVEEHHVLQVLDMYRKPCWYQTIWNNRFAHAKKLISPRALSMYIVAVGLGLQSYSNDYKTYGRKLVVAGSALNYLVSLLDTKKSHDLPLINYLSHIADIREGGERYKQSHALQKNAQTRDVERMKQDDARYSEQRSNRAEDKLIEKLRHKQLRRDRQEDKALEEQRYDQQRKDRKEDRELEAQHYEKLRKNRAKDKEDQDKSFKQQAEMHQESLRQQYIFSYFSGIFSIPTSEGASADEERSFLAKVREAEAARIGVDFNTLRVQYGRPKPDGSDNERYT